MQQGSNRTPRIIPTTSDELMLVHNEDEDSLKELRAIEQSMLEDDGSYDLLFDLSSPGIVQQR